MDVSTNGIICDNALDHILYECLMYYGTLKIYFHLLHYPTTHTNTFALNGINGVNFQEIALESHLLHLRNLLKFFDDAGSDSDKRNLNYKFLVNGFRSGFSLKEGQYENVLYHRICALVQHLSPQRMDNCKITPCEVSELFNRIRPCIINFWDVAQVPSNLKVDCHWEDENSHLPKKAQILTFFQTENCPNQEWMKFFSSSEFSDVSLNAQSNPEEAKPDTIHPQKQILPDIRGFTTTCRSAFEMAIISFNNGEKEADSELLKSND